MQIWKSAPSPSIMGKIQKYKLALHPRTRSFLTHTYTRIKHTPWCRHWGFRGWLHRGWTENTGSRCNVCRSPSEWACRGAPSVQTPVQRRWPPWMNLQPRRRKQANQLWKYIATLVQYKKPGEQTDEWFSALRSCVSRPFFHITSFIFLIQWTLSMLVTRWGNAEQ